MLTQLAKLSSWGLNLKDISTGENFALLQSTMSGVEIQKMYNSDIAALQERVETGLESDLAIGQL